MNAEDIVWPKGMKKTKQRSQVLSVLQASDKPLSARDICSCIENSGGDAWLSTVYRILEMMVANKMAIKTVIASDMALYELNRHIHRHYAICLSCRKIFHMYNCPMHSFVPELSDQGFEVVGHNLEIYGYCSKCKQKRHQESGK